MPIPSNQTLQQDAVLQDLLDLYARVKIELDKLPQHEIHEPFATRAVSLVLAGVTHLRRNYGLSDKQASQKYSEARLAASHTRSLPDILNRVTLDIALNQPLSK
jgi:hypothetical protein